VHGVALAPDFAKGFISAGRSNKVVVFDLKSLKVTGTADVGTTPDAITYEPTSHRIFTWNAKSEDATAIDAKTDKVLGSVPVKGKPEFAVADGKGHLFVNIETTNEVAEIDAQKLTVIRRWSLAGCEEPTGLAIDLAHQVLFSGCSNKVLVVSDAKTGAKIAALPIGDHVDGVAFDPGNGLAFSSNGDGTLTVIGKKAGEYGVLQNLETQRGARTLTLNPDTHQVYLVTANFEDAASAPPGSRPKPVPGTFRLLIAGPHK
jgi:YVTN family beta-propeller protein